MHFKCLEDYYTGALLYVETLFNLQTHLTEFVSLHRS